MGFKGRIKEVIKNLKSFKHILSIRSSCDFKLERTKSEVQRLVHQIEKGLSIGEPKANFGIQKIKQIIIYLEQLINETDKESIEVINRACSCIQNYLAFYEDMKWNNPDIECIKQDLKKINYEYQSTYGGVLTLKKNTHDLSAFEVLNGVATSRHSIRDFSGETVDISVLEKAISFSQLAPSACNRQGVRCYIIEKEMFSDLSFWLQNIGFFGDYGFDKIILITSKITCYNEKENIQHLVSPGIFVGYLLLALESLNVGACVMQRSLYFDNNWKKVCERLNIPLDEQSFCLIGCGCKKEEYKVPVSNRLSLDILLRTVHK